MLSVSQMLKVTKAITKKRSSLVKILKVKKAVTFAGKSYYVLEARTSKDVHQAEVILYNDKITKANLGRTKAWVSCSCGDFIYRCEHALYLKGSTSKFYTKGKLPGDGVTGIPVNPRNIPWICKHLVKIFANIVKIKTKPGKLPIGLAVKLALPETEERIPPSRKKPRIRIKKK